MKNRTRRQQNKYITRSFVEYCRTETSSKNGKNSLKSHAQSKNPTTRRATLERLEERRLLSISESGAIQSENESELYANECYVADPNHVIAPLILNTAGSGWTNNFIYDPNQPLFKDILNEDYTLADNSQAIDIGSANIAAQGGLSVDSTDFFGNPRFNGEAIDVGAAEYATSILAPTEFVQTKSSPTSLALSWNNAPHATKYAVLYKTSDASSYKTYETVEGTSCVISGLTPDTIYSIRIRAAGDGKDYANSNYTVILAQTDPDSTSALLEDPFALFEEVWEEI